MKTVLELKSGSRLALTSPSGVKFEVGDLSYLSRVCYDSINEDMTGLFFGKSLCFSTRDEECNEIF